jgi:hypothetical protein
LQLEISHLNSTVVSGYRTLLVKDSILEQRLAALRSPVRRTLRVYGIVLLYAAVLCFCILERGFFGFIWMAVATAIFAQSLLRFKRERAIVASYGKAVGTVLVRKKTGRRGGVRIKYGFFSAGENLQLGKVGGSSFMPEEGQTLAILYAVNDSSINLPLSSFMFYDFPELSSIPGPVSPVGTYFR